jgi:hypothetical protein
MSDRRKHDLGLADELGLYLANLLADFGRWIALLFQRKSNESPVPPAPPLSPAPPPALPPVPEQTSAPGTRQRTLPMQTAPRVPILRPQGPFNRPTAPNCESLPFEKAPGPLTKGERAFWYPLCKAVDGRYLLLCKVRLANVVRCPPDRRDEQRWFRKIGRYHCDFVRCDPRTTAPLLVVELDDRRHRRPLILPVGQRDRSCFGRAMSVCCGGEHPKKTCFNPVRFDGRMPP